MSCRFQSGSNTAITFQNITNINSTLFFCRASPDEFNYSSNPTYVNSATGQLNVISDEETEKSFTFITGIGLYDSRNNLLAVAKMSRPIEKNDEKDEHERQRHLHFFHRSTKHANHGDANLAQCDRALPPDYAGANYDFGLFPREGRQRG